MQENYNNLYIKHVSNVTSAAINIRQSHTSYTSTIKSNHVGSNFIVIVPHIINDILHNPNILSCSFIRLNKSILTFSFSDHIHLFTITNIHNRYYLPTIFNDVYHMQIFEKYMYSNTVIIILVSILLVRRMKYNIKELEYTL